MMASQSQKQTNHAHYEMQIPTHDPSGVPLPDLAAMGHEWLQQKVPRLIHSIHVEGPHGNRPYKHLKVLGIDSPEMDSHVKMLGDQVCQMSGHDHVNAHKHGQSGIQPWVLRTIQSPSSGAGSPAPGPSYPMHP